MRERRSIAGSGKAPASRRGSVAVQLAILITVLLGFVSLGTEVVGLYKTSRKMQSAADGAAVSSAVALIKNQNYTNEALAIAGNLGFANGAVDANGNKVAVTVNCPPKSGHYPAGCINSGVGYVEVLINQPQTLILANLFGFAHMTVGTRAVATTQGNGPACVVALSTTASPAVTVTGGNGTLNKCNLCDDSTSGNALLMTGGGLTASAIDVVGNFTQTGGSFSPAPTTGATPCTDPYQGHFPPAQYQSNACGLNPGSWSGGAIPSGVYCNGLTISAGTNTMSGVYVVEGGTFKVSGGTVTGSNVTIILTCLPSSGCAGSVGSSTGYANAQITGGTVTLTAPNSGTYSGIVLMQDANAPAATGNGNNNESDFTGGTAVLTGALYFPVAFLNVTGGSSTATCTQILGLTIQLTGGGIIGSSCAGVGITGIRSQGGGPVQLVE